MPQKPPAHVCWFRDFARRSRWVREPEKPEDRGSFGIVWRRRIDDDRMVAMIVRKGRGGWYTPAYLGVPELSWARWVLPRGVRPADVERDLNRHRDGLGLRPKSRATRKRRRS